MNPQIFEYDDIIDRYPCPECKSICCVLDRSWMTDNWYVTCSVCTYKTKEFEEAGQAVEDWIKRKRDERQD